MFDPKYTITPKLLSNIKRIAVLIENLNNKHLSKTILVEFEKEAREVSSYTSTSIEGNPLPLTDVKRILKHSPKYIRDTEKEVINYNNVLKYLNKLSNLYNLKFSKSLVLDTHKQITLGLLDSSKTGHFRNEHVVVNNPKTGNVVYIPPDFTEVKDLMNDLLEFINTNNRIIDPLILAGIFHKQMVIIHPFIDGNGRTARVLTKVLLAKMGLDTFNLFSFENYYNKNVTKYFRMVGEYGDYNSIKNKTEFSNWLEYFTDGIIDELLRVQKLLDTQLMILRDAPSNLNEHNKKILKYLKTHTFITDKDYSKITDRAKATRVIDFNKLIDLDLVERQGKGPLTYYVLTRI